MRHRPWIALAAFALLALTTHAAALPATAAGPAVTAAVHTTAAPAPVAPAWDPAALQTPAATPSAAAPPLAPQIHCPLVCPGAPCHVFNGCLVCEC